MSAFFRAVLPAVASAALLCAPASADPSASHEPRMGAVLQSLDLSDTQKDQVRQDMLDFQKARHAGKPESKKELRSKIESVLTPDQRAKFDSQIRESAARS